MYRVTYHKQALKMLLKMPRGAADRMRLELARVAENPQVYTGDWKPLTGTSYWRLRVGGWRAVCDLHGEELVVYVLKIGSRGDVYK